MIDEHRLEWLTISLLDGTQHHNNDPKTELGYTTMRKQTDATSQHQLTNTLEGLPIPEVTTRNKI